MMIKTMRFSKDRWSSSDELTLLPIDARKSCASVFSYPLFALGDDDDDKDNDDEDNDDEDYDDEDYDEIDDDDEDYDEIDDDDEDYDEVYDEGDVVVEDDL